jgi:phage terminase Nu1 subunit (DNA packaging protein)
MPNHVDMEETKQDQNLKIIEMAKKRRHIHLLEKMQRGKSNTPSLKPSEIKELEKLASDPNSPGIVDSQEKVAKIFNVSVRTVARWAKDGMPVTPQGMYDLLDIRAWRLVKNKRAGAKEKENNQDLWDSRYREYKARLAEITLKKATGDLIPKETIERELVQVSLTVKHAFLGLPKQVAPQLAGLDPRPIEVILSKRIKEIINEFAIGNIFGENIKKITKNAKTKNNSSNME